MQQMKRFVASTIILIGIFGAAAAQDSSTVKCVVTAYELRSGDGHLIKSLRFDPKIGEEELTNKLLRLPDGMFVVASIFPTDESMNSAGGVDSLRIALALSRRPLQQAFGAPDNAVAEVTFKSFDTLRAEKNVWVGRRH